MISTCDVLTPICNQEIVDLVEKTFVKSTATTKEQKQRIILDIFHTFLLKLNKNLYANDPNENSDLMLQKAEYITSTTKTNNWPAPENLKVSDLHRLTLFMYNYLRSKYTLRTSVKKDGAYKAFENLVKFFEVYIESQSGLSEELVFGIFRDFFMFYQTARENSESPEAKEGVLEDMGLIIDMLDEETSKNPTKVRHQRPS